MANVNVGESHLTFRGIKYFRGKAESVTMGAIGDKKGPIFGLVLVLICLAGAPQASAEPAPPTPEGFDHFAVYMAAGLFDPTSPHPDPAITGCFLLFCDGHYFQEVVMGWNPAEIAEEEAAAVDFYWQRFGLDVETLVADGRISFLSFYLDPRAEYRLYHLAGVKVPAEGWEVRDGGFLVTVLDPEGIDLGGEQTGGHAPADSFMVFGHYNILAARSHGRHDDEIVIRYKSAKPITPLADGSLHFACEIEHKKWGSGLAQGISDNVSLADGFLRLNVRNVLTFPGLGH